MHFKKKKIGCICTQKWDHVGALPRVMTLPRVMSVITSHTTSHRLKVLMVYTGLSNQFNPSQVPFSVRWTPASTTNTQKSSLPKIADALLLSTLQCGAKPRVGCFHNFHSFIFHVARASFRTYFYTIHQYCVCVRVHSEVA